MIKVGDKAKGFEFTEQEHGQSLLAMTTSMYYLVGTEGTIAEINHENDSFMIEFRDCTAHHPKVVNYRWWYPISKYLEIQREERLNELGILCDAEITQKSGI